MGAGGPGGTVSFMGYIGTCGSKRFGFFFSNLVRNRVSILIILVPKQGIVFYSLVLNSFSSFKNSTANLRGATSIDFFFIKKIKVRHLRYYFSKKFTENIKTSASY